MTPFEIIQENNLLDWTTLLVGLDRGWCKKEAVIKYTENQLLKNHGEIDTQLIDLINSEPEKQSEFILKFHEFLDHHEIEKIQDKINTATLKWRFAFITSMLEEETSEQEKIDLLQEIYGQFGFPEDMASCSIYHNDGIDPLEAAKNVVKSLRSQFNR